MGSDFGTRDKAAILGVIRFISERGYGIKWDDKNQCYRITLPGLDPENDEHTNEKFISIGQAYYTVLQRITDSPPY